MKKEFNRECSRCGVTYSLKSLKMDHEAKKQFKKILKEINNEIKKRKEKREKAKREKAKREACLLKREAKLQKEVKILSNNIEKLGWLGRNFTNKKGGMVGERYRLEVKINNIDKELISISRVYSTEVEESFISQLETSRMTLFLMSNELRYCECPICGNREYFE